MESNTWCPLMTAARILSELAVHAKGFGSALLSATKRLIAAWRSTTEWKTPRFNRRFGKKNLDGVEPGARGWCEVEDETRVAIEPGTNVRMLVGSIVVENNVDDLPDRHLRLDGVQKSNEFLMTMAACCGR
jgi:hypothetical protein